MEKFNTDIGLRNLKSVLGEQNTNCIIDRTVKTNNSRKALSSEKVSKISSNAWSESRVAALYQRVAANQIRLDSLKGLFDKESLIHVFHKPPDAYILCAARSGACTYGIQQLVCVLVEAPRWHSDH